MPAEVAKIAVSAATYWIDKPYDYLIPEEMREQAVPGVRVSVPFSKGNRRCEGIILAVAENSEYEKLKAITEVLDEGWRTGDIKDPETPEDKIVGTAAMGDLVVAHL